MTFLYCDLETYSETPIGDGTRAYAEDPSLEIMLFAYAFESEDPQVVDLTAGESIPQRVLKAFDDPAVTTVWHNGANFDRVCLREALGIDLDLSRLHDTMVQALSHGLPGGLDKLCEIFKLPFDEAKDKTGKQLIQWFCKPRPKNVKTRRYTRHTHPQEWEAFKQYAKQDIPPMRALHRKIPSWNYQYRSGADNRRLGCDRSLFELDQRINDRGFAVDVELAQAALATIEQNQDRLAKRTRELTRDEVKRATQRDLLLQYIVREHDVLLPDMKKSTLERRLNDESLPAPVRELIALRLQSSTTSTSKYKALLKAVSKDGRLRGTLQFCGASRTGRWAGRVFQPQNLPRPQHKAHEIENAIRAMKAGCLDVTQEPDDIMAAISSSIRGAIVASPGRKLVVSDLSNIEGRFAAWCAGEDWKCDAFRAFDRGEGPDLYVAAYARAFGVDPAQVSKDERQIGKVMELMLQYGGGAGAFLTGALTYGIDLDDLGHRAWDDIPETFKREAIDFFHWTKRSNRSTFGLSTEAFTTCEALKRMWRAAHPEIESYWKDLETAARKAWETPGKYIACRNVGFLRDKAWLRLALPSCRSLCYPSVQFDEKGQMSYMGVCPYTRRWKRIKTHGGKLFENICQGGARDVMAWNMPLIEDEGYPIILTVHDELLTEPPDRDDFTSDGLSALLATPPMWAPGIPLAAGGFETYRYRKD